MDDTERRALVVGPTRDDHWFPDQISGRIAMERSDLAVSGESIYRAVHSGVLDCELPRHRKAPVALGHHGKRRRGKGFRERRGKEFSDAEGLQGALGAPVCFCCPTIPGSTEPTRTPTNFSGACSRRE
jgi:hypothetical protein